MALNWFCMRCNGVSVQSQLIDEQLVSVRQIKSILPYTLLWFLFFILRSKLLFCAFGPTAICGNTPNNCDVKSRWWNLFILYFHFCVYCVQRKNNVSGHKWEDSAFLFLVNWNGNTPEKYVPCFPIVKVLANLVFLFCLFVCLFFFFVNLSESFSLSE